MTLSRHNFVGALLAIALVPCVAMGQDTKTESSEPASHPSQSSGQPKVEPRPYSISITIKESSSGKAVVDKTNKLNVIAEDPRFQARSSVRDQDRIPYQTDKDQNYQNVGTNIDVINASQRGDGLAVVLQVNSSALVPSANPIPGRLPQVSEWNANPSVFLLPGKPTLVYSSTDGISGHKVEIEATAQPLSTR